MSPSFTIRARAPRTPAMKLAGPLAARAAGIRPALALEIERHRGADQGLSLPAVAAESGVSVMTIQHIAEAASYAIAKEISANPYRQRTVSLAFQTRSGVGPRKRTAITSAYNRRMSARSAILLAVSAALSASAQTFTTLANFNGSDGFGPQYGPLIQATDGNFYGTTAYGGAQNCPFGCGTIFRISAAGALETIHRFTSTDGNLPLAGLVQGVAGRLYGTTTHGGVNNDGTAFAIDLQGTLTTLHNFTIAEGISPWGLVQVPDGNFYGTTYMGGSAGKGTVFRMTPDGTLTTIYTFCAFPGCPHGANPAAALLLGADGNLYGTTLYGGARPFQCQQGCGTVFRIATDGTLITLHSFVLTDGAHPSAPLIQGADGTFYGTTKVGGSNEVGTVFRMTPQGSLTTMLNFTGGDGGGTVAGLLQATEGYLYGTATYGGGKRCYMGCGTIFEIAPDNVSTTLYYFTPGGGDNPYAGLVHGADGRFYGTTSGGGNGVSSYCTNCGTVFALSIPANDKGGTTCLSLGCQSRAKASGKLLGRNVKMGESAWAWINPAGRTVFTYQWKQ